MRSRWRALRCAPICAFAMAAALAACSTVPSSGPSRTAVLDVGTQPDAPYLLVPVSNYIIERLQHFPGPSLYGRFGDYRPAVEQTIGVGDTLTVTIYEAAGGGLFSQPVAAANSMGSHSIQLPPQVVQRDGAITVPYAGRVDVVGQTPQSVEKTIVTLLTGKAIEPQVVVTLSKNVASSITLTGEGLAGGRAGPDALGLRLPLSARGDRLLDVVADAGGLRIPANETFLELTRGGKTVRVPFQTLMANPKENIYARPGDTLTLVRYPLSFTAMGATSVSAVVPFDALGISLEEAIGKVAGFNDFIADPAGVFVFRYEPIDIVRSYPGLTPAQASLSLVPVVYSINMRDPRSLFLARRFAIHDKDIVFVSDSIYNDLAKVSGLIQAVSQPVTQGVGVAQSIRGATSSSATAALIASGSSPAAAAPVSSGAVAGAAAAGVGAATP